MADKTSTSATGWLGYLMGLISSATFGLIPLLSIPVLSQGVSEGTVLICRSLIAALIVGNIAMIRRESLRVPLRSFLILFALSVLYLFSSFLLIKGYQHIPSGVTTVPHFSYPTFVVPLVFLVFRQRINILQGLAVLLALNGASLISGFFESDVTVISLRPLLTVLFSSLCYTTYIVILRHTRLEPMSSFKLTTCVIGLSTILFALFYKTTDTSLLLDGKAQWIYTVLLTLIPTVCTSITLVWAVRRIGSTPTAIMGVLEPLTAMVVDAFALGEELSLGQGIGIGVVLVAVLLPVVSPLSIHRLKRA